MCFSQPAPKAPKIVYQGPKQSDLDAQAAALETYRQQSMAQQQQFATALQTQIDQANQRAQEMADQLAAEREAFQTGMQTEAQQAEQAMAAERQKAQLDMAASTAAAASENAALTQASYGVNTAQVTPTNPLTTEPPKPKKKEEKGTLKIGTAAVSTTAGTGVNIGI